MRLYGKVDMLYSKRNNSSTAIPKALASLFRVFIKHYTGNCHVYVDRAADLAMAESLTVNAKCQRMGVCNAAESLLVHRAVAGQFLPRIGQALAAHAVEIRGDAARRLCRGPNRPATRTTSRSTWGRSSR